MKYLFVSIFALFFLTTCESNKTDFVQTYKEDGTPSWCGEAFTNPRGFWAGYNDEKGFYASGEAKYGDEKSSTTAAELDAKRRLVEFIFDKKGKTQNVGLVGVQRVDRFVAEDGRVFVLVFISQKNVKKSMR